MRRFLTACALLILGVGTAQSAPYTANWASLDRRPVATWWTDAKFGIFVHWGPYAVPAYAPTHSEIFGLCYSEWYCGRLLQKKYPEFLAHHAKHYGSAPYESFAAQFTAENFDPARWAALFKKAGAKYVVLTAKHHDGFALWPSPESPTYNAAVVGAKRDLAGEFTAAMKAAGLKSGFYYSLLEYANPLYPGNFCARRDLKPLAMTDWARQMNLPQMKELVENYQADILWADGEWDHPDTEHLATEFLAWLFNSPTVRPDIVTNDRWGSNTRGRHGGHFTTEYGLENGDATGLSAIHPWEECRGIGRSFGYNRYETAEDYMSREKCIETLVQIVSAGGNLLLNVGPTADGSIPPIMEDRLLAIGRWLDVNGEAIYGTTRATRIHSPTKGERVYLTQKGAAVYVIVFDSERRQPARLAADEISLACTARPTSVSLLGSDAPIQWTKQGEMLRIRLPALPLFAHPAEYALVFKVECDGL